MTATSTTLQDPIGQGQCKQWTKAILLSLLLFGMAMLLMNPAFAQTGGATGTSTASQTRILGVVTGWQLIMFGIGTFVLSGAFMFVGYSMAWGGKKWSDVAMVAYGALFAGMGPMLVSWIFS
jgi:hypothetical protein